MNHGLDKIFFGGTFDPIHNGHFDIINIIKRQFPTAPVTVVPSFSPPVSAEQIRSPTTPFIDRVAMAVVAVDEITDVDVSSIEEDLDPPSYTYKTLEALSETTHHSNLGWVIGSDQLLMFSKWKNPRRILELASLIVVPRAEAKPLDVLAAAREVVTSIGFKCEKNESDMRLDVDGAKPVFVTTETPRPFSSTAIRELAKRDLNIIRELVPATVLEYISDLGLYEK